jgi:hypothetical protein
MLPIIRVPELLAKRMECFRKIFCRGEGFEPICRFITGLILSPNKTLQGIYDLQVWEGEAPSRRAMHEAVFELGWDSGALIEHHRTEVVQAYQGRGRQVISALLDACPSRAGSQDLCRHHELRSRGATNGRVSRGGSDGGGIQLRMDRWS